MRLEILYIVINTLFPFLSPNYKVMIDLIVTISNAGLSHVHESFFWAAIPLAVSAISAISNMVRQGKERRRQERRLQNYNAKLEALYNKEYYTNPLDTDYSKTALNKINETYRNQSKRDTQTAQVMGSSEEAQTAAKGERAKGVSDAVAKLTEYGASRKDNVMSRYLAGKMSINQQLNNVGESKVASGANMTNNLWNATSSLINSGIFTKNGMDSQGNYLGSSDYNQSTVPQDKLAMLENG